MGKKCTAYHFFPLKAYCSLSFFVCQREYIETIPFDFFDESLKGILEGEKNIHFLSVHICRKSFKNVKYSMKKIN